MTTINEIETFRLQDAVTFHDELNPKLFRGRHLHPEVEKQLKTIAEDFIEEMGLSNIDIVDITVSGSNAAYSYTKHSDLDLHLLVDMSKLNNDAMYLELFDAKKTIYNDTHDITIRHIPVELYIQDSNHQVTSVGEYSILRNEWIRIPSKRRANFDQTATAAKYEKLSKLIDIALTTSDLTKINHLIKTIHRYRQAGLDQGGEFGPENLAYKAIRTTGQITKLYALRDKLHSRRLSIEGQYSQLEESTSTLPKVLYHVTPAKNLPGIMSKGLIPKVGSRSAQIYNEQSGIFCFPDKVSVEDALMNLLGDQFDENETLALLAIDSTGLQGKYTPGAEYEVVITSPVPVSNISVATKDVDAMFESASGYIPSNAQKNDPRWKTALTVDIKPDTMKKNAKKFGWNIKRDGTPPLLRK